MRGLSIRSVVSTLLMAMVAVALWQGYNGDIGAIIQGIFGFIQQGANALTSIWHSVNAK